MSDDAAAFSARCLRTDDVRLAKVSAYGENEKVLILGTALKQFLKSECLERIADSENLPMVYSYMSDCTAHEVQARQHSSSTSCGGNHSEEWERA